MISGVIDAFFIVGSILLMWALIEGKIHRPQSMVVQGQVRRANNEIKAVFDAAEKQMTEVASGKANDWTNW